MSEAAADVYRMPHTHQGGVTTARRITPKTVRRDIPPCEPIPPAAAPAYTIQFIVNVIQSTPEPKLDSEELSDLEPTLVSGASKRWLRRLRHRRVQALPDPDLD